MHDSSSFAQRLCKIFTGYIEIIFGQNSKGSRDGAVVRALASHQCGPGSIPGPGAICGLSLLLVLVPAPRVFLRVLRFSSLHKNQHFQIPIRSGIRGPQVCQSRDCYVLPSLNNIYSWFFYLSFFCCFLLIPEHRKFR